MTKNIFLPLEVHEAGLAWDAPSEAQYDLALFGGKLPPINTVNVCKIYIASTSVGPSFYFILHILNKAEQTGTGPGRSGRFGKKCKTPTISRY